MGDLFSKGDRPVDKEVYSVELSAETTHHLKGDISDVRVENLPTRWRVDDISRGIVYLAGFHEGPYAQSLISLDPETARNMAEVLNKAADYAEEQQEGDDGE